jgi:hypothetical protein
MNCVLDHLVVAAATLEQGSRFLEPLLGVLLQPGGKHALMGTHNRLLRLDRGAYLELIAIDPDAPPPARPRWFGLDTAAMRARIAERPRLIHWVAQTDDIDAALLACPLPLGAPTDLSRGDLRWRFALSDDGSMPLDGMAPDVIQWLGSAHPTQRLPDAGLALLSLQATHPRADVLRHVLETLGFDGAVNALEGAAPALHAQLRTPRGEIWLD